MAVVAAFLSTTANQKSTFA